MKLWFLANNIIIVLFIFNSGCATRGGRGEPSAITIQQGEDAHEKLQNECKILQEIQASGPDQAEALETFKKEVAETGASHGFLFSSGDEDAYVDKSQFEFYEESVTIYGEAFDCS